MPATTKRIPKRHRSQGYIHPSRTTLNAGKARKMSRKKLDSLEQKYGLTVDKVCKTIMAERGVLFEIAATLGVTRRVLREYIADRELCAATLKEAREAMGDVAEKKLYDLIEAGDVRCIMYYLTTVHRNRGYGGGKRTEAEQDMLNGKFCINTINVVAVPPGKFLSANEIAKLGIEHRALDVPAASAAPDAGVSVEPWRDAGPASEPDGLDAGLSDGGLPVLEPA